MFIYCFLGVLNESLKFIDLNLPTSFALKMQKNQISNETVRKVDLQFVVVFVSNVANKSKPNLSVPLHKLRMNEQFILLNYIMRRQLISFLHEN